MSDPKYDNWFEDAHELGQHRAPGLGVQSGPVLRAQQAVDAFARRAGASTYWRYLNRLAVARDVRTRLENPNSFAQGNTFLCGIATFVRVWATDNPVGYAQLAIDLFEKGKGQIVGHARYGGKDIAPSDALLASPVGGGVPDGDWIVLASIREAFNSVFDYGADEGIFRIKAWNMPSDVGREFRAAGYTNIVEKAGLTKGGIQSLEEASDLYDDGWRVILLVHSDIISSPVPLTGGRFLRTSNHWIGLNSAIDINRFGPEWTIKPFDVYSWNGPYKVPKWGKPVPMGVFNQYYFGYVAGLY
jgi:hypothetical protein